MQRREAGVLGDPHAEFAGRLRCSVAPAQLQRILVSINDTAADEQAVRVACTLGQQRKAQIFLIYVNVVSYQHPIDVELEADPERGELALERASSVADSLHCRLETELLQWREAGPVIVAEASARRADLIAMSAGFKTVSVPPELTRTTKYV